MDLFIVLVGTELLNGKMIDTNSSYIAEELNKYGIKINGKIVIGDEIEDIIEALSFAQKNADMVVISGGLGPTIDDITRDAIAKFLSKDLILNEEELNKIQNKFEKLEISMPERNIRQAMLPEGSIIFSNKEGAAPAFCIDKIAAFPGVTSELKNTFPKFLDYLYKKKNLKSVLKIKDILLWGLTESHLEKEILDIMEEDDGIIKEFLVKDYGIIIRFIYHKEKAKKVAKLKKIIYKRVGDYVFGEDADRIEKLLLDQLIDKKYNISVLESCTGGMINSILVSLPGISQVLYEGLVTYNNESKMERLGVKEKTLKKYGAVSRETVEEMLKGVKTDTGIAVSGILGPDGGTKEKPVGLVFIGTKLKNKINVERYLFRGERNYMRQRVSLTAINDMLKKLNEKKLTEN